MSIFEYDEVKEKELMRQAEYDVGLQDGLAKAELTKKVFKLFMARKSAEEIAEELELSTEEVEKILK